MSSRLDEWRKDEVKWIHENLRVKSKLAKVVPLISPDFPAQEEFAALVRQTREEGLPIRIAGLKARQVGLTSIADGILFNRTVLYPNVSSLIISMDLESAKMIHDKNEIFYDMLPAGMRPMRARSSTREMVFANPSRARRSKNPGLRSRIWVESAKKLTLGRSHTIHNLLASEVAYWKDGAEVALAALNAVPEEPGTCVILDSTANGVGDFFYDMYEMAKKPYSTWKAWFFPWFKQPEYRRRPDDIYNADDLEPEEQELMKLYNLDLEQICWRRMAIVERCSGDVELFRQEMPSNDEEAFLTSGRPAFSIPHVRDQRRFALPGTCIEIQRTSIGVNVRPISAGPFRIFEPPQHGHTYSIGADCSSGAEDGDFQCAEVIDALSKRHVAEFHAMMDPVEYAFYLDRIARMYNNAVVAVEKNGDGVNVVARLAQIYDNQWREERWDETGSKMSKRVGWLTTDEKKRLLMHDLQAALRHTEIQIRSGELLDEMEWMQRDKHGRFGAPKGKHDDRVMAFGIALWVSRSLAHDLLIMETDIALDPMSRMPIGERISRYHETADDDLEAYSL